MAGEIRHPLSGYIYGVDEDGLVRVEKDGRSGRFHWDGRWVEGEVRFADPQLCLWVGGPQLPPGMNLMSMLSGDDGAAAADAGEAEPTDVPPEAALADEIFT